MNIPQIKSTIINLCIILIGIPIAALGALYVGGELKTWSQIPSVLDHSLLAAVGAACGWLGMRSPFAARFTSLMVSEKGKDSQGVETSKETKVEISEPVEQPATPSAPEK